MNRIFARPMFPILGVIFLLLVYGFFDQAIIHCGMGSNCSPISVRSVFGSSTKTEAKSFGVLAEDLKRKEEELDAFRLKPPPTADSEKKDYTAELQNLENRASVVRQEIASRYSYRMSWTFLTAVFFLLCVAAIGLSITIIVESDVVSTLRWVLATSIFAALFAIVMFLTQHYMRVIKELYDNTVFGGHDLPEYLLNFFNVIGFVATIFLVVSVSAILFSVEEKEVVVDHPESEGEEATLKKTEEATVANFNQARRDVAGEPSKEMTDAAKSASVVLAEKYEKQMNNLKFVLYVGAAILFVAVLQLDTLAEWHRAFLPLEFGTAVSSIHSTFFKTSVTFQAGIYTIMLAVLYLPAAYIIKQKAALLRQAGVLPEGELDDRGLSFKFWEFMPRLLTILSPFLAAPIVELVKKLPTGV